MPNDPDKQPVNTPTGYPSSCPDVYTPQLTVTGGPLVTGLLNGGPGYGPWLAIPLPQPIAWSDDCEWELDDFTNPNYQFVVWAILASVDPTGVTPPSWRLLLDAFDTFFNDTSAEWDNPASVDGTGVYTATDPGVLPQTLVVTRP